MEAKISDPSTKNGADSRRCVAPDELGDLLRALDRMQQQQELVAADSRQHVGIPQFAFQAPRQFHQQRIAVGVAVIVVDVLEIVEVEKRQCESFLGAALQQAIDPMLEHPSCRKAGQFVVDRPRETARLRTPSGR